QYSTCNGYGGACQAGELERLRQSGVTARGGGGISGAFPRPAPRLDGPFSHPLGVRMSPEYALLRLAILLPLGGGTAAMGGVPIDTEPQFYRESALPPGEERQKHSQEFVGKVSHLYNAITYEREWRETFTEEQINSYFDEDFIKSAVSERVLPD